MARSDAAKRADAKYKASKTRQLVIRFYPSDSEILAHLEAQGNKQGYIKRLIADDMAGGAEGLRAELEHERAMCEQFQADMLEAMQEAATLQAKLAELQGGEHGED